MAVTIDEFGCINSLHQGQRSVHRITLRNDSIQLQVINYGAAITSLHVKDVRGNFDDVVLGFDDITSYVNHPYYFGAVIGRVANRIAKGKFNLNGKTYSLAVNDGIHHLHGGVNGFDKALWDYSLEGNKVTFSLLSQSMEEGYPGDLSCSVSYELTNRNEIIVTYYATSSEATPVNLTNHTYFNLASHGHGKIQDHLISINADFYCETDETSIPTGELLDVTSTNFDLRKTKALSDLLYEMPNGFDHNFCINGKENAMKKIARVEHPDSGRVMEVYSTQPGVQFYTANFLPVNDSLLGKKENKYKKFCAFCLETQNYPDAINHANFPKAYVDEGEEYKQITIFYFPHCNI